MDLNKLASAILNDIVSGLRGLTANLSLSVEQLEDEIVEERMKLIKEYSLKGIMPSRDLWMSINCLEVDCRPIEKCNICMSKSDVRKTLIPHVEIPQIFNDFGNDSISYFGSVDRNIPFKVYTDISYQFHVNNRWIGKMPYVYIDTTPNENNMYDCFIFNAPFIKTLSLTAIFKDPRQLLPYSCCSNVTNITFLESEIKSKITQRKLYYYRQLQANNLPNDQVPKT